MMKIRSSRRCRSLVGVALVVAAVAFVPSDKSLLFCVAQYVPDQQEHDMHREDINRLDTGRSSEKAERRENQQKNEAGESHTKEEQPVGDENKEKENTATESVQPTEAVPQSTEHNADQTDSRQTKENDYSIQERIHIDDVVEHATENIEPDDPITANDGGTGENGPAAADGEPERHQDLDESSDSDPSSEQAESDPSNENVVSGPSDRNADDQSHQESDPEEKVDHHRPNPDSADDYKEPAETQQHTESTTVESEDESETSIDSSNDQPHQHVEAREALQEQSQHGSGADAYQGTVLQNTITESQNDPESGETPVEETPESEARESIDTDAQSKSTESPGGNNEESESQHLGPVLHDNITESPNDPKSGETPVEETQEAEAQESIDTRSESKSPEFPNDNTEESESQDTPASHRDDGKLSEVSAGSQVEGDSETLDLDDDKRSQVEADEKGEENATGATHIGPTTSDKEPAQASAEDAIQEETASEARNESSSVPEYEVADNESKPTPREEKKVPKEGSIASFFEKAKEKEKTNADRLSGQLHRESDAAPFKVERQAPVEDLALLEDASRARNYTDTWGILRWNKRYADIGILALLFDKRFVDDASARYSRVFDPVELVIPTVNPDGTPRDASASSLAGEMGVGEGNSSQPSSFKGKRSVNAEFVEGLDDLDKFFEGVDPPDELDVGAAGTSIQDVLMGQTSKIIIKRVTLAAKYVSKAFKNIKVRVSEHFSGDGQKMRMPDKGNLKDKASEAGKWLVDVGKKLLVKGRELYESFFEEDDLDGEEFQALANDLKKIKVLTGT
jgi:hypothetical protein